MYQFAKAATLAVALLACGSAFAQGEATPVSAAPQDGLTQELSAACRTVVTTRWSNGRRISVRKRACSPSYGYAQPYRSYGYAQPYYGTYGAASCRTVVKTRYSNGRRVSVRTRVC
jgi:hypothetical protein